MRILVLGQGKTGKVVVEVAAQRGHSVSGLDVLENAGATALTPPFVAGFDVAIDFTTPEAAVQNMRAVLATGGKIVVGTTGWYDKLADMRGLAERKGAGLLYGTN
jgi:4-hydroxy-tetrahydrodipicolinate reductase